MSRQTRNLFFSSDAMFKILRFVRLYPSFSCKLYLRFIMHMHAIKLHVWACLSISKLYEMNVGRLVQFCAVPTRSPIFNSKYSNSAFLGPIKRISLESLRYQYCLRVVGKGFSRSKMTLTLVNLSSEYRSLLFVCFLPEANFWHSGIVVACVCLCVRPSVRVCDNHLLVRAITHHPLKLGSPNLVHMCKIPWFLFLLIYLFIYLFFFFFGGGGVFTLIFKVKF